jgi:predicted lipoprotein with Yx(FWY)xxD motif
VNRTTTIGAACALAIAGALLAGCGSSSTTSSSTTAGAVTSAQAASSTQAAATTSAPTVVISTTKTPEDGTLISGANGRTLYVFKADEKSTSAHAKSSTCYGGCANVWPPVIVAGTPTVAGKANASLIGVTTRRDGTKQVTYNGLPLYYYAADTKAGQATGNHLKDGFGLWIGMLPSGQLAPDGAS